MKPIETWLSGQGFPYAKNQENSIKAFEFKSGAGALLSEVRSIMINSAPWFYASDVCIALGLSHTRLSNEFELISQHEEMALEKAERANKNRAGIEALRQQIKSHQGSANQ